MITLKNIDCLELLKSIENEKIDLVVIDPPYLIDYKTNYRINKINNKIPRPNPSRNICEQRRRPSNL